MLAITNPSTLGKHVAFSLFWALVGSLAFNVNYFLALVVTFAIIQLKVQIDDKIEDQNQALLVYFLSAFSFLMIVYFIYLQLS